MQKVRLLLLSCRLGVDCSCVSQPTSVDKCSPGIRQPFYALLVGEKLGEIQIVFVEFIKVPTLVLENLRGRDTAAKQLQTWF